MFTVWKFEIEKAGENIIVMPIEAELLHVAVQGCPAFAFNAVASEKVFLWARVDPNTVRVKRSFFLCASGRECPGPLVAHVGTVLLQGGEVVLHLFDCGYLP